jgi:hypothetical protein
VTVVRAIAVPPIEGVITDADTGAAGVTWAGGAAVAMGGAILPSERSTSRTLSGSIDMVVLSFEVDC